MPSNIDYTTITYIERVGVRERSIIYLYFITIIITLSYHLIYNNYYIIISRSTTIEEKRDI